VKALAWLRHQRSEPPSGEHRRHYELERRLADRLRHAGREERSRLYREVYNELFRELPDHPQLRKKQDPARRAMEVASERQLLARFVGSDSTLLEIGAGDCALSFAMAKVAKTVLAVDVSDEITRGVDPPGARWHHDASAAPGGGFKYGNCSWSWAWSSGSGSSVSAPGACRSYSGCGCPRPNR
jgi:hypothetical protein